MPPFVASDLDLRRLLMSHKKNARLIWVKVNQLALSLPQRGDCKTSMNLLIDSP